METCDTLLALGSSASLLDKKGYSPLLAVAPNENVAICMALLLEEALKLPPEETRRSIHTVVSAGTYLGVHGVRSVEDHCCICRTGPSFVRGFPVPTWQYTFFQLKREQTI